jgi:hypothetical protein
VCVMLKTCNVLRNIWKPIFFLKIRRLSKLFMFLFYICIHDILIVIYSVLDYDFLCYNVCELCHILLLCVV